MKKVIMGGITAVLLTASCWASMPLGSDLDTAIDQLRESVRKGEMTEQDLRLEIEALARKHRDLADANLTFPTGASLPAISPDVERCRSALLALGKMDDKQSLPVFEELSLSAHWIIRTCAIFGYVEVAGLMDALPFIDKITKDSRYTRSDLFCAYRGLERLFENEHEQDINIRRPPPVLSPAEWKKFHLFMLEKIQTSENESAVELMDNMLNKQLSGYSTSVQRLAVVERLAQSSNEYRRKYGEPIKAEIEKVPANQRKDFRAKSELLDPERKEE